MKYSIVTLFWLTIVTTLPAYGAMTVNYTYDALGRLTSVNYSEEAMSGAIVYGYDNVGNIPALTVTGSSALGDINFDGHVNLADAIMVLKTLAGNNTTEMNMQAKVTSASTLGIGEVIYILRQVSGM